MDQRHRFSPSPDASTDVTSTFKKLRLNAEALSECLHSSRKINSPFTPQRTQIALAKVSAMLKRSANEVACELSLIFRRRADAVDHEHLDPFPFAA